MKTIIKLLTISLSLVCSACGKEFLDIKQNSRQAVPKTIADYQAVLDYQEIMIQHPPAIELGVIGSDETFLTDGRLTSLSNAYPYRRNAYIWADEIYEGGDGMDWNYAFQRILYANMALDINKLTPPTNELDAWKNVKGSALFYRAYNYYQLAQLFCNAYDSLYAKNDLGLPIRRDYDVTDIRNRSSLYELYKFILADLSEAADLLPIHAQNKLRPSKPSAYALLAKAYLQMADYKKALMAANAALDIHSHLIDFNDLDLTTRYLFPQDFGASNPEVLYYWHFNTTVTADSRFNADTALLELYGDNDLRKLGYFYQDGNGRTLFKGSYDGGYRGYFTGLATDELWLIKAECHARVGEVEDAMQSLNHLLSHRYYSAAFTPRTATSKDDAVDMIIQERRKELFMRGIRWEDLRRINKEPSRAVTLKRHIDGKTYELPPNDLRWVWPIPPSELQLSGIPQNPR